MAFDARLLAGISLLDAVVEAGGFAKAGDAVGLTPSGVSRAIARLEERIGARLFDRNARRVTLTEAGRRLHAEAAPLLNGILEAAESIGEDAGRVRGRLKASIDPWFARIVLAPRLPEFLAAYPELALQLRVTNAAEDMLSGGVDVAVRFGPPAASAAIGRKLFETRVITVASPGLPNHISDEPITSMAPNAAIHGLRRPEASAIAPRTGDISAIAMPAAAVAKPHSACPLAASGATWVAK